MLDNLDISMYRGDDVTFILTIFDDIPNYKIEELRNLAKKQRLSLWDYIQKNLVSLKADGTIVVEDLTDCEVKFSVRKGLRGPLLFQLTTTDGTIVLTNPTVGEAEITIASTLTTDFLNVNFDYVYDVQVTSPTGKVMTVVSGKLSVLADVTYD